MKKKIIEAFRSGVLHNMITKASKEQQSDKTDFQSSDSSSDPNDPKGKKTFFKDTYPRDQRIDHAIDAVDSLMYAKRKGVKP